MVDFGRPYYTPMDQQYHHEIQHADKRTDIEKPIFPISSLGITVPEADPSGRSRNIVEGIDAAFKAGAGNIQLVMQVPGQVQPIGGGPKAYGEEVREAIRELQKAAGAKITGVELPTSINNLSGFSPQQNVFSDEQRQVALAEVRDSIKFIGDIAGGGGVDIVSFEFPRNFSDATWANNESEALHKKEKDLFRQREEQFAVDTETGRVSPIDKKQTYYLHKDPETFKDTKEIKEWKWKDFERWGEEKDIPPEKLLLNQQLDAEIKRLSREAAAAEEQSFSARRQLRGFEGKKDEDLTEDEREAKGIYEKLKDRADLMSQSFEEQTKRMEASRERSVPIADYGLKQSTEAYGEAGIWAMQESQKNQFVQRGKGSVHVGPEIGWPTYYGSHPREWVELIKKSRGEMVNRLTKKEIEDPFTHEKIENPYFDPDISKKEAEELAKMHIKGELDTGHLGMWLQNFRPELSWDKRVSEFKKWFKDQMEYLAEENKEHDIIGGIQAVDSATGAHGHLPPGQGVLGKDIVDYMKILKEKGNYKGEITSEGHEEEKFGQGRILTKTWETFGAPISLGYLHGRPAPTFGDLRHAYSQIAYGTTGIFQSYVPSNDFTLWSQVPLE